MIFLVKTCNIECIYFKMSVLSLTDIFKYAHCTPDTRNFIEGEQVFLAKHVILCGKIGMVIIL